MSNKEKWIIGGAVLVSVFIVVFGVSYAWLQNQEKGKTNTLISSDLSLILQKEANAINLIDAYPVLDKDGLKTKEHTFEVVNNSTIDINVIVKLLPDNDAVNTCKQNNGGVNCKIIPITSIRYGLSVNGATPIVGNLGTNNNVLTTMRLAPGDINKASYSLRIWLDQSAANESDSAFYYGKIEVTGEQIA